MDLFISDLHLGGLSIAEEREKEDQLSQLFNKLEPSLLNVYIVGDLFHQFMEYGSMIPKGSFRTLSLIDELVQAGKEVIYFLGNRDPWHIAFFEEYLDVQVVADSLEQDREGRKIWIEHGDRCVPRLGYRLARPVMRSKSIYWLYRNLMPGDSAFRVAKKVSNFIANEKPETRTIEGMRDYAFDIINNNRADFVVMGHSHWPEHQKNEGGDYINLGSWADNRTFATLEDGNVVLRTWNDGELENVESFSKPKG